MAHERFDLVGRFDPPRLAEWLGHRARRLSLAGALTESRPAAASLVVSGPAPLLDAMHAACLLGPASARVDDIRRTPLDVEAFRTALAGDMATRFPA